MTNAQAEGLDELLHAKGCGFTDAPIQVLRRPRTQSLSGLRPNSGPLILGLLADASFISCHAGAALENENAGSDEDAGGERNDEVGNE